MCWLYKIIILNYCKLNIIVLWLEQALSEADMLSVYNVGEVNCAAIKENSHFNIT